MHIEILWRNCAKTEFASDCMHTRFLAFGVSWLCFVHVNTLSRFLNHLIVAEKILQADDTGFINHVYRDINNQVFHLPYK